MADPDGNPARQQMETGTAGRRRIKNGMETDMMKSDSDCHMNTNDHCMNERKYTMKNNSIARLLIAVLALTFAFASVTAIAEETVTIKGIVDLVPHSELVEFVAPKLAEQGIIVDLVATSADSNTNERLSVGEIDFNFFQHVPYLQSECEANGFDLVSVGAIHVEPITAYSDKYASIDELPENPTVALPNNVTNEYRALRILEQNGFIKLAEDTQFSLAATVTDIVEYVKPIQIIELDEFQVIPTKDEYDFYIINTNKILEAGLSPNKLFSEGPDSPYANVVVTRAEDAENPAVLALVDALKSEETREFIRERYGDAVVPVE